MPFKTSYNSALGVPTINLAGVSTVALLAVGTVVKGFDDVQGEGEFMYLPGVASLAEGDFVAVDLNPGGPAVVRSLAATHANSGQVIACAMAAIPAASYGFYQISGVAIGNVIAATAAGRGFVSATAGQLTSVAAAGAQMLGGRISTAVGTPAAGKAYVTMNRPFVQGQIT